MRWISIGHRNSLVAMWIWEEWQLFSDINIRIHTRSLHHFTLGISNCLFIFLLERCTDATGCLCGTIFNSSNWFPYEENFNQSRASGWIMIHRRRGHDHWYLRSTMYSLTDKERERERIREWKREPCRNPNAIWCTIVVTRLRHCHQKRNVRPVVVFLNVWITLVIRTLKMLNAWPLQLVQHNFFLSNSTPKQQHNNSVPSSITLPNYIVTKFCQSQITDGGETGGTQVSKCKHCHIMVKGSVLFFAKCK